MRGASARALRRRARAALGREPEPARSVVTWSLPTWAAKVVVWLGPRWLGAARLVLRCLGTRRVIRTDSEARRVKRALRAG